MLYCDTFGTLRRFTEELVYRKSSAVVASSTDSTRCCELGVMEPVRVRIHRPASIPRPTVKNFALRSAASKTDPLRPDRFEQHVVSVEIEKLLLTVSERANINSPGRIDPHAPKRGVIRNRRNNQPPVVFESDESTIEQVIDARRQQQSVLAVQSFLIGCVAPRLTMARDQMNGIIYTCDPASGLDLAHPILE